MDKQKILNKYSKAEDKLLISKMLDKLEICNLKNKMENTDFLDMYQINLLEKILKREKVTNYILDGGINNAERKCIIFYPDKLKNIVETSFITISPLKCIRIILPKELNNKYVHRDYLGALIKLGLKREKVGDILVFEDGADILILEEILKFVLTNLSSLTRFNKANINEIKLEELRSKEVIKQEIHLIVSSMRLDCIISELLNTSRGKAEEIIKDGRVFVNFENISKVTKQIKENDLITIRGKGRFEIEEIEGYTKNERVKLIVNKFI